jgi:hypothetical protein
MKTTLVAAVNWFDLTLKGKYLCEKWVKMKLQHI